LKKDSVLFTPDVIEECLSEALDVAEKSTKYTGRKVSSNSRIKKSLK